MVTALVKQTLHPIDCADIYITDGVQELIKKWQARWLLVLLNVYEPSLIGIPFHKWAAWTDEDGWQYVTCTDVNGNLLVDIRVEDRNLPLQGIKLYTTVDKNNQAVVCLGSEYLERNT